MSQLLGALFAILVGIISLPTYLQYQNQSNENLRIATTAQQATVFNTAAAAYVQQNSTAIQATATATTPAVITVAMMKAVNLLPAAFSATNPYGQTWVLEVLQPSAGNLQALAMTTGGTALLDKTATKIATIAGQSGGFIPQNDSGVYPGGSANAYGAYAGWTLPTTNYTSVSGGELASLLTFNNGQLTDNRLYRNLIPGQPQLNQMNTPLIMASTQSGACTSVGAIAQDGNGGVVSCQSPSMTWQAQGSAYWKDPVDTKVALNLLPCNASAAWQTRIVKSPSVGTGPRAYTCDGTTWQALAVDDNGNLTVGGSLAVGSAMGVGITTTSTVGAVCVSGAVAKTAAGAILYCDTNTLTYRQASAGEMVANTVQIAGVVTENAACPNGTADNGRVARDSAGMLLSCQSGTWSKLGKDCPYWSGDLNWLEGTAGQSGCVNGAGLGNAPTGDWFFIEYNRHVNPGNYYVSQRAVGMTGGAAGQTWIRSQQSGSAGVGWGAWTQQGAGSATPLQGDWCGLMWQGTLFAACQGYSPPSCPSGYGAISLWSGWSWVCIKQT